MAVWTLAGLHLYNMPMLWTIAVRGEGPITLVTAPHAANPNLHAQQGVFTLHRTQGSCQVKDNDAPSRASLDEVIASIPYAGLKLSQFTLPHTEAKSLHTMLIELGAVQRTFIQDTKVARGCYARRSSWLADLLLEAESEPPNNDIQRARQAAPLMPSVRRLQYGPRSQNHD
jgi:hypothetical protein